MKHLLLSLISALLLSIAWPTYGIPFFLFFALVPLLMMEHDLTLFSKNKKTTWRVFGLAYLTFTVWNAVTTGWLYGSQNPDGSHSLMAVLFPVLINALLYTIVFTLYHWYKKKQGTYWGLAFLIALWMAFEKFHLEWEFSWPWLNLGNAFAQYPKLIQWYDTFGATGGSLWVLSINVFIFYTLRIWQAGRQRKALIKNSLILGVGVFLPMGISLIRYSQFDHKPTGEINVLMLQPDLDPYQEKYQKDSLQILNELLQLAEQNATGNIDFYIAPETAIPGRGSISETGLQQSLLIQEIQNFLASKKHAVFLTGLSSHRLFTQEADAPKNAYAIAENLWVESYNSAIQISSSTRPEVYHKGKLVPGVEIFPYMTLLKPLLGEAMLNFGGTIASLGTDQARKVFRSPYNTAKAAPVICYESIYGEFTADYVKNGANFLAIMTNDSWWGVSQGHKQLLAYAQLRAIETRREIARAANSGISAHINALGEIEADTFYGDQTALPAKIKLYEQKTFYVRAGDLLSRFCIFALGFLLFYPLVKKLQKKNLFRSH